MSSVKKEMLLNNVVRRDQSPRMVEDPKGRTSTHWGDFSSLISTPNVSNKISPARLNEFNLGRRQSS
jgi:hypothetical protein